MWRGNRRLERLEKEVAEARAERAALQRRVDLFEKIAEAAGATLDDPVPGMSVPASLLSAARDPCRTSPPVRLVVDGDDVIAVMGEEGGDPREWWTAIQRLTSRLRSAS